MQRIRAAPVVAVALATAFALAGCLGFYRAEVPAALLGGDWKRTDTGGGERWLGLAAKWAHVTYEADPPRKQPFDTGPYPASLTVLSIDTPGRLDRGETSDKLDAQVRANAEAQGIQIDTASKQTGERTLRSGVRTLYFTYEAVIGSGSGLFDQGRAAKVIGEVWFDEKSKITVLTVGLAQVQGGGATGQSFTERTNWIRIVADPEGTIEGHTGDDGLIDNTRSHAS